MSTLADQPAFPGVEGSQAGTDSYGNLYTHLNTYPGMTYRQWLAGIILQGVMANPETAKALTRSTPANIMADVAVTQADHLIAELEKTNAPSS